MPTRNESYVAQRGRAYDFSEGVDNILMEQMMRHENQWAKILDFVRSR
jgi:hypothetical protein